MPDPAPDNRPARPEVPGDAASQSPAERLFEVNESNTNIDEVLSVLDSHIARLEWIATELKGHIEEASSNAHIAEIRAASDAIMKGELTLAQVQTVRESMEWAEKKTETLWLPEAGPYIPHPGYSKNWSEDPQAKEKPFSKDKASSPVLLPEDPLVKYWPNLPAAIGEHAAQIRGEVVSPIEVDLKIPEDRRKLILAALMRRTGITICPIEVGMEFPKLPDGEESFFQKGDELDSTAARLSRMKPDGPIYGLHGTDALTYALLAGVRVIGAEGNLPMLGTPNEFYMTLYSNGTFPRDDNSAFAFAVPSKCGLELLALLGLTPTDHEKNLAELGVLLAIDLGGYNAFSEKRFPLINRIDDNALARTPPPSEFIRPISCFKYIGGSAVFRGLDTTTE